MDRMHYISTRGQGEPLDFEAVLLAGLAGDGGLFVPQSLPHLSAGDIAGMRDMDYAELAFTLMRPFVAGSIPDGDFRAIVDDCYGGRVFRHRDVAPLAQLAPQAQSGDGEWVMELFHGPTLAFKDFALQLLGRLLDYVLERRQRKVVIMGATSGDTGSAAIEGCRHCRNVDIFILHPHGRISTVQRRQMTTAIGDNIHNIALQGSFDDCQAAVKDCFGDRSFLPPDRELVAVNSINWARIMAQIVYYFYGALKLGAPSRPVSFSVPTGNFGDIFAGYLARSMGLPVERLIIATNRNDVLHRTLASGVCERPELHHTLSPSMDITVSSNFERLLFDLYDRDGAAVADLMSRARQGAVELSAPALARARALFDSRSVDDPTTCQTIREVWESSGYLLDPHSAVGVRAARDCRRDSPERHAAPTIALATAHPAKFPDAIREAGVEPPTRLPPHISDLFEREERCQLLPNDLAALRTFVKENCHV